MWILVFLLDFLGRKNFLRFLAGWVLIMLFFLYCFVYEAFDRPQPTTGRDDPARAKSGCRLSACVRFEPLTSTLGRCQRLLDCPGYVIILPSFVPFVRQIARTDRVINVFWADAMR